MGNSQEFNTISEIIERRSNKSGDEGKSKGFFFRRFMLSFFLTTIILLFLEIILRAATIGDMLNIKEGAYVFVFTLAIGLFMTFLLVFLNGRGRYRALLCITVFFMLYYSTQLIYHKIFGNFMILSSVGGGGQAVTENYSTVLQNIGQNIIWLLFMFLPLIILIVSRKKLIKIFYKTTVSLRITTGVASFIIYGIALLFVIADGSDKDPLASKRLYFDTFMPNESVARFGLIVETRLDINQVISQIGAKPVSGEVTYLPGSTPDKSQSTSDGSAPVEPEPIPKIRDQIIDIDFNALIQNEKNAEIKKMHEYVSSVVPTKTNDHTGKFAGYNVIYLTAESFSDYAVREDLTPTLYKMSREGYNFTNFYNPEWTVSTSDGEYANCMGLIPKAGVWSFYKTGEQKIYLPFTLGNQYRFLGTTPRAYHPNTYNYYNRDVSHPNAGYVYKGYGNGLQVKKTWPESDLEMIEKSIDEYINDPLFHVYYMTVSGHMNYTWSGNYMSSKHKSKVANLPYNEEMKAYLACNIELDLAMEYLIQKLEEKGIADKTLIVIGADHYPYGMTKENREAFYGKAFNPIMEQYKNRLIIWSKDLKGDNGKTVDKLCDSTDILPTVLNMLGLQYDSRMLVGRDIFDTTDLGFAPFLGANWVSEHGYYIAKEKKFTQTDNTALDGDYVKNTNSALSKHFWFSANIINLNYYKYAGILTKEQADMLDRPLPLPPKVS